MDCRRDKWLHFFSFVLSPVRSTTVVIMQFKFLRPEDWIFSALVYDQLQFLNLKSYIEKKKQLPAHKLPLLECLQIVDEKAFYFVILLKYALQAPSRLTVNFQNLSTNVSSHRVSWILLLKPCLKFLETKVQTVKLTISVSRCDSVKALANCRIADGGLLPWQTRVW